MYGTYSPSATVYNSMTTSLAATAGTVQIVADENQFWVARKILISHDAIGATDFDNLLSRVSVTVAIGGVNKHIAVLHPGNGGTSSLEFEAGPWCIDLSPGLYTGTKNEELLVTTPSFGTGIVSYTTLLYS